MKIADPVHFAAVGLEPLSVRIPIALSMTGLSRSKFYELVQEGEIETVKVGRSTLVIVASLRTFLECRRLRRKDR